MLEDCQLSREAVDALTERLKKQKNLEYLDVFGNPSVGQDGGFFRALPLTLTALGVSHCELTTPAVHSLLFHMQQNENLKELEVVGNPTIGLVPAFAETFLKSSLESLDLRKCNLPETFIAAIIECAETREKGGMAYAGTREKVVWISGSDVKNDTQKRKLEEIGPGIEVQLW